MTQQIGRDARIVGRRYLFHVPGITYAVTTIVLILGAINGQNNFLFALFGLATGGLIISGVLSGANLMGVRVTRLQSLEGKVGEPTTIRYRVSNTNRLIPACAILIEELPAKGAGGERLSNIIAFAGYVGAGESVVVEATATGRSRGLVQLQRFQVTSTFPFGLTRKSVVFECIDQVLVYPRPAVLRSDPVQIAAGELLSRARSAPSRMGDEFHSLREYVDGDPLRSVAWRASARGDALLVREHTRRSSGKVMVEIDAAAEGPMLEHVISCAAALCQRATEQGNLFALARSGGGLLTTFGTGRVHLRGAIKALAMWGMPSGGAIERAISRPRDVVRITVVAGAMPVTRVDGAVRVGADDPSTFDHAAAFRGAGP